MKKIIRYEFLLRAEEPIAHHSGTQGNHSMLMTEEIVGSHGEITDVPVITGDTLRHHLRAAGSDAVLSTIGLDGEDLEEGALRLLYGGGVLREAGSTVSIAGYREMVDLLPHLALFGGALKNTIERGGLTSPAAVLCCEETRTYVSDWAADALPEVGHSPWPLASDLISSEYRTSFDPRINAGTRKRLKPAAGDRVAALLASRGAHSGEPAGKKTGKERISPMPRSQSVVVRGAVYWWAPSVEVWNDLEEDTALMCLGAFFGGPSRVGGKQNTGHGRIQPMAARHLTLTRSEDRAGETFDLRTRTVGEIFRAHTRERSEKIAEWLAGVKA